MTETTEDDRLQAVMKNLILHDPAVRKVIAEEMKRADKADDVTEAFRYSFTSRIELAIDKVKGWDREYVEELREHLHRMGAEIKAAYEDGAINDAAREYYLSLIVISDLPSEPIPEDVDTSYPVWAMDKHGYCLFGEDLQGVASLDKIREYQADRRVSSMKTPE